MLGRLAGVVPVPRPLASADPAAVRMAFVPGPLAEQWVVSGYRSLGVDDVGEAGSQVADGVLGERVGL